MRGIDAGGMLDSGNPSVPIVLNCAKVKTILLSRCGGRSHRIYRNGWGITCDAFERAPVDDSHGCVMKDMLTKVPPESLAKMASRHHLLTTGCVPWTLEGFAWACQALLEPTAPPISVFAPERGRHLGRIPLGQPVRVQLRALRMTTDPLRLHPILVSRYGLDAGTAHYCRYLAIVAFVNISFFLLSASRLVTMIEDEIVFTAALIESLVKMSYPAPDKTPPFALQAVLQDMQHRKEESGCLQALPEGARVKLLVERDYRHGLNLLRAALAWDPSGYDDAMAYLDDVHAHPERYSSYLRAAKKIDPGLVPEWAVLEAYLFHRYGPEVGMTHSLRLAALTEFLDANRDRLMQEGLGVQSSSGDIGWNRELLEILCTIPVTVSEIEKPVLALESVLQALTRRRDPG